MKKTKRLLSLCMALVMIMTGLVFSVGANAETLPGGDGAIIIDAPGTVALTSGTISTSFSLKNTTGVRYEILEVKVTGASVTLSGTPTSLEAGASRTVYVGGTKTDGYNGIAYTVRYRVSGSTNPVDRYTVSAYSYYAEPTQLSYTFANLYRYAGTGNGSLCTKYRAEGKLSSVVSTKNEDLTADRDKYWCEGKIYYDKDKYTGFNSGSNPYPLQYSLTKIAGVSPENAYGEIWARRFRIGVTGAAAGSGWVMSSVSSVRTSAQGGAKSHTSSPETLDTSDSDYFGGTSSLLWATAWGDRPTSANARTYNFDNSTSKPSSATAGNAGRLDDAGDSLVFTFTADTASLPYGDSVLWFDLRTICKAGSNTSAYIALLVNYNLSVYSKQALLETFNRLKDTSARDYYQGDDTWVAFVTALANAAYFADENNESVTQSELDAAAQNLQTAFNNLRRAARLTVNHAIERAGSTVPVTITSGYAGYAGESYTVSLLSNSGENTYTNYTQPAPGTMALAAGDQSVTVNYWTISTVALEALCTTSVTHAASGKTFAGALDILENYESLWTPASWSASGLEQAYQQALAVLDAAKNTANPDYNTTRQADVDAAVLALQNAVNQLKYYGILSIKFSKSTVAPEDFFTVTVVAGEDTDSIEMKNTNGMRITPYVNGTADTMNRVDNGNGTVTFTFDAKVGTPGLGRTFLVYGYLAQDDEAYTQATSPAIDIVMPNFQLISLKFETNKALAGKPVLMTVVTRGYLPDDYNMEYLLSGGGYGDATMKRLSQTRSGAEMTYTFEVTFPTTGDPQYGYLTEYYFMANGQDVDYGDIYVYPAQAVFVNAYFSDTQIVPGGSTTLTVVFDRMTSGELQLLNENGANMLGAPVSRTQNAQGQWEVTYTIVIPTKGARVFGLYLKGVKVKELSINVVAPDPAILSASLSPESIYEGEEATLTVTTNNSAGASMRLLTSLGKNCIGTRTVTDNGDGTYTFEYPVPSGSVGENKEFTLQYNGVDYATKLYLTVSKKPV